MFQKQVSWKITAYMIYMCLNFCSQFPSNPALALKCNQTTFGSSDMGTKTLTSISSGMNKNLIKVTTCPAGTWHYMVRFNWRGKYSKTWWSVGPFLKEGREGGENLIKEAHRVKTCWKWLIEFNTIQFNWVRIVRWHFFMSLLPI